MLTFPVIPAKAGIQVPLEADIVLVRDSGLRRNDEIGLLNCLIIKCQHYLASTGPLRNRACAKSVNHTPSFRRRPESTLRIGRAVTGVSDFAQALLSKQRILDIIPIRCDYTMKRS